MNTLARNSRSWRSIAIVMGAVVAMLQIGGWSQAQGSQRSVVMPDATALNWTEIEFKPREVFPPSLTAPFATLEPDAQALDPNARLVVRVVDAQGKPVPNAFVDPWIEFTTERHAVPTLKRQTDASGLCTFPELEDALAACFHPEDRETPLAGAVYRVGLQVSLPMYGSAWDIKGAQSWTRGERVWLTSEPSAKAPVELQLPPASWLDLRFDPVLDRDGNPLTDIGIRIDGQWTCLGFSSHWLPIEPGADHLLLGPLPLEQTLKVELMSRKQREPLGTLQVESSAQIGAIKTARIERIEQGAALAPSSTNPSMKIKRTGMQLDSPDASTHDKPELLASGIVMDTSGVPIPNAQVKGLLCQEVEAHLNDWGPWDATESVRTDEQGRFELTSTAPFSGHQHLRLEVAHPNFIKAGLRNVTLGSDQQRFEMTRAYHVNLQVRTDAWLQGLDALSIRIRSGDETYFGSVTGYAAIGELDINRSGLQEPSFAGLPAGPATLEVLLNPEAQSVSLDGNARFWQTDIEVQDDMDLGQLDLRGQFVMGSFLLQDGDGKPWRNAPLQLTGATPDGPIAITARTDSEGRLTLFLPASASDGALSLAHEGRPATEAVRLASTAFDIPTGGQPFRPTVVQLPIE